MKFSKKLTNKFTVFLHIIKSFISSLLYKTLLLPCVLTNKLIKKIFNNLFYSFTYLGSSLKKIFIIKYLYAYCIIIPLNFFYLLYKAVFYISKKITNKIKQLFNKKTPIESNEETKTIAKQQPLLLKLFSPIYLFSIIGYFIYSLPRRIFLSIHLFLKERNSKTNFSFYTQGPDTSSKLLLYVIVLLICSFVLWASWAEIDERAVSEGQVVPSSKTQYIQNLEGGILSEIKVKEGDIVKIGDPLVKLNDIQFSSTYGDNKIKYYALLARLRRLEAEASKKEKISFPKELIKGYPTLISREVGLFKANKAKLDSKLDTLNNSLVLVEEQHEAISKLVKEQILSRLELLKIEKELNNLKGEINLENTLYFAKTKDELVKVKSAVDSLKKLLFGFKDQVDRTLLKSPVYGIVKKININTTGQTIKPGESIMEIVPLGEKLVIEAKILPNDIAFIQVGQVVDIKLSSYDPSIYGGLPGKLKHISADTIIEKDDYGRDTAYYKILVESDNNHIAYRGKKLPIIPGMQATVNIVTGKKTILQYILKPIIKTTSNAFGER